MRALGPYLIALDGSKVTADLAFFEKYQLPRDEVEPWFINPVMLNNLALSPTPNVFVIVRWHCVCRHVFINRALDAALRKGVVCHTCCIAGKGALHAW